MLMRVLAVSPLPANVSRHFLPWDRPLLPQAVAWLARDWSGTGPLDLARWLVVVPTRQAGRRLREALAEHAAEAGQAVFPPRVVTPESFISQGMAAGTATLEELRERPPYAKLERLGGRLEAGFRRAAFEAGVTASIARVGSMLTIFFQPGPEAFPVTGWQTASRSDTSRYAAFFWGMIDRGIYLPCSQYEALFFSSAHTDADIDATIAAAADCLASLATTTPGAPAA